MPLHANKIIILRTPHIAIACTDPDRSTEHITIITLFITINDMHNVVVPLVVYSLLAQTFIHELCALSGMYSSVTGRVQFFSRVNVNCLNSGEAF